MENNTQPINPQPSVAPIPTSITPPTELKTEEKTEEKKEEPAIEIPEENWRVSPLFYEVAHYLGVDEKDYEKAAPKMSLITDWAIIQANSNKMHDILPVISKLEQTLMKPTWGETRYNVLYRYLRLAIKKEAFEKALNAFKVRGGK